MTSIAKCDFMYGEQTPCNEPKTIYVLTNDGDFYIFACKTHIPDLIPENAVLFIYPANLIGDKAHEARRRTD